MSITLQHHVEEFRPEDGVKQEEGLDLNAVNSPWMQVYLCPDGNEFVFAMLS